MGTTAWLIGSNPSVGAVTITIQKNGQDPQAVPVTSSAQALYLYDNGSQFDAIGLLQAAIQDDYTEGDLSETLVYLTRDRKVRIEYFESGPSSTTAQIISWSGAGASAFQELLGLTGTETAAGYVSAFTAPETSPYLWSGNKPETPSARLGELGIPYYDTAVGMSGTRVVVATTNNSGYTNDFLFQRVLNDRYWTNTEEWGEYFVWWDAVQRRFRKFKLWRDVNELDGSTTAATLATGLGPYIYRWDGATPLSFPMSRDLPHLEYLHTVDIPVVVVDEYT